MSDLIPEEPNFYSANDDRAPQPNDKPSLKEKLQELKQKFRLMMTDPKKRLIFIISAGFVIIALVGTGLYFLTGNESGLADKNKNKKTKDGQETENVATDQAPLDGIMTSSEAASRHPLAIVVENHPDARPQAGLDKASIVYETIAEGGITRFLAVFGTNEAEKVGPVRSARTYFVDWARGYDAYLGHVGGNIDALDQIKAEKVLDLDQFAYSSPYWRERSRNVSTEHTMFTSTPRLREQAEKNGYSKANNFTVYKFKDLTDTEKQLLPEKQVFRIAFSSEQYEVAFEYDKASNSYKRHLAGAPHVDQLTKNQIIAKNVIVMTVDRKPTTTRINESGYDMSNVGSGPAKIFLDGKMIEGKWKKNSKTDREMFYDADGNEITFNRGQFWIAAVQPGASITIE
ncbi:MAG: DUF3048 domain-containing protein [Patescibacteria group bacterium]|jgi:hypothetical protein